VLTLPALEPISTTRLPLPRNAHYTHAWLSPTGKTVVMTRDDGRADVWDLIASRRILSVNALPGALAAISRDDSRMILLDGKNNELVALRSGRITPIKERARFCRGQWQAARFSDDGSTVVAGASCAEVLAWDARTGRLLRRATLPGQVAALALSHDKRVVAVASPDGRLSLISLAGGQRTIPEAPRGIDSLAFGPGDKTIAAGITDKTVRIWDVKTENLLRSLPLQAAATARFTPNGRWLVAADLTGALRVFHACPNCANARGLLSEAGRRVTRQLTQAERRTYLSGF
jgi:WD40 repeat protein